MFSLFQGAKLVQKLVLKKYVFVNLFIKFLEEEKRGNLPVIFCSPHTRLRQLADFPSLIVRSSFAVSISEVRGK